MSIHFYCKIFCELSLPTHTLGISEEFLCRFLRYGHTSSSFNAAHQDHNEYCWNKEYYEGCITKIEAAERSCTITQNSMAVTRTKAWTLILWRRQPIVIVLPVICRDIHCGQTVKDSRGMVYFEAGQECRSTFWEVPLRP